MYYKLIKGRLCHAPDNIRELFGNPTAEQYLFFGYKPLDELVSENKEYIGEREVPEPQKS